MAIEAVIFDCDGTLVDSETIGAEVLAACAADEGVVIDAAEAHRRFTGRRMADCVAELGAMAGGAMSRDFETTFRSRMAEAFRDRLQPIEGAAAMLAALDRPCCLASSGPREKIELTLSLTGLRRWFPDDRIFSAYELGAWKPDPALFLHAAAAMGVAPGACAVVEDSPPGIAAGLAAGMSVFAFRASASPAGARPLGDLRDLPALLR